MDIDNRNFIDVMKELSSSAGVELPKDNTENKKLSYTRQVTKPPVAKANTAEPVTPTPQQPTDESYNTLEPVFLMIHLLSSSSLLVLMNQFKKVIYMTYWKMLLSSMSTNYLIVKRQKLL